MFYESYYDYKSTVSPMVMTIDMSSINEYKCVVIERFPVWMWHEVQC